MHRLAHLSLVSLGALALALAGCANGSSGVTPTRDGSVAQDGSAERDGSTPMDGSVTTRDGGTTPHTDGGAARDGGARRDAATSCPTGEHACGSGCVVDLANEPANGCRLGCGEPCDAPANASASCGMDGRCAWACEAPFRRDGDACVCTPRTCESMMYECGAPDDGCGHPLDCGSCSGGASCTDGRCGCSPDSFEPNNTGTTATRRPGLNDADDPDVTITTANLHTESDEDWFAFPITDGFDWGNPTITVSLTNIPTGSNYDLAAYYSCGDSTDNSTCTTGTADNTYGRGCASRASGSANEQVVIDADCSRGLSSDDDGTLLIRVHSATWARTCGSYQLAVRVR